MFSLSAVSLHAISGWYDMIGEESLELRAQIKNWQGQEDTDPSLSL